jgi:guanosine-3',5'-bis(diphosphate) 3'-pyrophosphohydrolase
MSKMHTHNLDELTMFYKKFSSLDLLYDIAIKKIDLKELKEFTVLGDKLIAPKPEKPIEPKPEYDPNKHFHKKDAEL